MQGSAKPWSPRRPGRVPTSHDNGLAHTPTGVRRTAVVEHPVDGEGGVRAEKLPAELPHMAARSTSPAPSTRQRAEWSATASTPSAQGHVERGGVHPGRRGRRRPSALCPLLQAEEVGDERDEWSPPGSGRKLRDPTGRGERGARQGQEGHFVWSR